MHASQPLNDAQIRVSISDSFDSVMVKSSSVSDDVAWLKQQARLRYIRRVR